MKVKIVQGGSTGLVQQRNIPSYKKKKKGSNILPLIQSEIKRLSDSSVLVFIAGGIGYTSIEEDAKFMNKNFGHKVHDFGSTRPYIATTIPYYAKSKWIKKLDSLNLRYAFLSVIKNEKKVTSVITIREVTDSSEESLLGQKF